MKCDDDASLVKQLLPTVNDNPITACMSEVVNAINKKLVKQLDQIVLIVKRICTVA